MTIKKYGKKLLCRLLENQAKRLIKKNDLKIIAVVGSVGKTSTKMAIAKLLSNQARVNYQDGNYNDRLTVPLVLFDQAEPSIFNLFAWLRIAISNEMALSKPYNYDISILELGPDGPNQLKYFSYLKPDLCVLSAIAPEHMEFFKTLDNVAKEELVPLKFSKQILVNIDDCDAKYLTDLDYKSYGLYTQADYKMKIHSRHKLSPQKVSVHFPDKTEIESDINLVGAQGAKSVLAAIATAKLLNWSNNEIKDALKLIVSVPGRMQILKGINDSLIIDDSYNASPIAVKAALDVLYTQDSPKVAILGSMNELGPIAKSAHEEIGRYCHKDKLDLLITIGDTAKDFLAPNAIKNGVTVKSFLSPYEAGEYLSQNIALGSVVLVKGSQNGVYSEEAIKPLLMDASDSARLVRQSKYWLKIKQKQFPS